MYIDGINEALNNLLSAAVPFLLERALTNVAHEQFKGLTGWCSHSKVQCNIRKVSLNAARMLATQR